MNETPPLLSQPPRRRTGWIVFGVIISFFFVLSLVANFALLAGDDLYLRAFIGSLGYAALAQAEVCRRLNDETLLMATIETPDAVANAEAIASVEGIDVLHIGASDLSTAMAISGQYQHERMRAAFETVAKAARSHGKAMGVGGVRQDFEFQSWLLRLGVRYLTGGSDVGYILSAGRADVKQLRELKLS